MGDLEKPIIGQITYLTPYFIDLGAGMCIFLGQRILLQKFCQNQTFGSHKNGCFMSNYSTRALLLATPTSLYFFRVF